MAATTTEGTFVQALGPYLKAKATLAVGTPFHLAWTKDSAELAEARSNWVSINRSAQLDGKDLDMTADFFPLIFEPSVYQLWHDPAAIMDQISAQLATLPPFPDHWETWNRETGTMGESISHLDILQWRSHYKSPNEDMPYILAQLPEADLIATFKPVISSMREQRAAALALHASLEAICDQTPPARADQWTIFKLTRTIDSFMAIPDLDKWVTVTWPRIDLEYGHAKDRTRAAYGEIMYCKGEMAKARKHPECEQEIQAHNLDFPQDRIKKIFESMHDHTAIDEDFKKHADAIQAYFEFTERKVHFTRLNDQWVANVDNMNHTQAKTAPHTFIMYGRSVVIAYAMMQWMVQDESWRARNSATLADWPNRGPRVQEFFLYLLTIRNVMQQTHSDTTRLWNALDGIRRGLADLIRACNDAIDNASSAMLANTRNDLFAASDAVRTCGSLLKGLTATPDMKKLQQNLWYNSTFAQLQNGVPNIKYWAEPRFNTAVAPRP